MIRRIEYIKKMGIYDDFSWNGIVENDFSRVNVFYGRNYSGKTTLSRIIRTLELGLLHKNYPCSEFGVTFSSGEVVSERDVARKSYPVRVFNADFIVENLSYLAIPSGDSGDIKPFAVLGSKNNVLETRRAEIMRLLGRSNDARRGGLDGQLRGVICAIKEISSKIDVFNNDIDSLVTNKATSRTSGIKYNPRKFGDQNYTKSKLYKHIEYVIDEEVELLSEDERDILLASVDETVKSSPKALYAFSLSLKHLRNSVSELLARNIAASERIQSLSVDYVLEQWVRSGMELHKKDSKVCLFCGSQIFDSRWNALKKHFDRTTETLRSDIERVLKEIETHRKEFEQEYNLNKSDFYSAQYVQVEEVISAVNNVRTKYLSLLNRMREQLLTRERNITQSYSFEDDDTIDADATETARKYGELRNRTIEYTTSINNKIKDAQTRLLYNEVLLFIQEIDYVRRKQSVNKLEEVKGEKEKTRIKVEAEIKKLEDELTRIDTQITSEKKAVELVNRYLTFFSCDSLRLEVSEESGANTTSCRFNVVRGHVIARNLSDGERSLIAFCYFLAKLDENSKTNKKPIVWIDDPISSLDGDHVFMTYSLLRSVLVESGKVEQLFVSTHNLDFFKYLTRLQESPNLYLISRTNKNAKITCLPDYMKKHVTEFNYLFKQIYMCAYSELENSTEDVYYDFGNNARKFLELYLFYKYPDHKMSHDEKMSRFFGNDVTAYFINRVDNERSHLLATFERASLLVDIPELKKVARLIIETIRNKDNEQYEAFLSSVGLDVHAHAAEIEQE